MNNSVEEMSVQTEHKKMCFVIIYIICCFCYFLLLCLDYELDYHKICLTWLVLLIVLQIHCVIAWLCNMFCHLHSFCEFMNLYKSFPFGIIVKNFCKLHLFYFFKVQVVTKMIYSINSRSLIFDHFKLCKKMTFCTQCF